LSRPFFVRYTAEAVSRMKQAASRVSKSHHDGKPESCLLQIAGKWPPPRGRSIQRKRGLWNPSCFASRVRHSANFITNACLVRDGSHQARIFAAFLSLRRRQRVSHNKFWLDPPGRKTAKKARSKTADNVGIKRTAKISRVSKVMTSWTPRRQNPAGYRSNPLEMTGTHAPATWAFGFPAADRLIKSVNGIMF
jgi:hypothetical protein